MRVQVWNVSALKGNATTIILGKTSIEAGECALLREHEWNRVKHMDILHAGREYPAPVVVPPPKVEKVVPSDPSPLDVAKKQLKATPKKKGKAKSKKKVQEPSDG
jgi:hypothetical protein